MALPDPARVPFAEAVAWFRGRVPITPAGWRRLNAEAKRRAFTVSRVAALDVILDVWRAVDRAVADGTGLAEFQRDVTGKLEAAWGGTVSDPGHRVETIYRTNVQGAYAAGRKAQQTDPDVLSALPYLMYDALLDDNTSVLCRSLHGTILPADHAFWSTHYPPNHFGCRSGARSLTAAAVRRRGGVSPVPALAPQPGFDREPGEWRPDLSKYPPRARAAYQQLEREFDGN